MGPTWQHAYATGRTISALLVVTAAIGLSVIAIVGWTLWQARLDAQRNAAAASANLAMSVAHGVENAIAAYDRSMVALGSAATAIAASDAAHPPGTDGAGSEALAGLSLTGLAIAPDAGSIAIADDTGRVIASFGRATHPRGSNVAGLEIFVHERASSQGGLDIGRPFRFGGGGSGGGDWMIALTRRLNRSGGRFGGIVMATMPLSELQVLTERLDVGRQGAVAVLRLDGVVLARSPAQDEGIGAKGSPPAGLAPTQALDAIRGATDPHQDHDGHARLFSYSRVGSLPVVVTVAVSTEAILAEWQAHAAVIVGVTGTLLAGLLSGALILRRELLARIAAEDAARGNTARFQLLAENSSDVILRLDRDGVQHYVSPSVQELLGHAPGTLAGCDWTALAEPDDRPLLNAAMRRLRAGAERATVQYRCQHESGHAVWVEASLRLVRDEVFKQPLGAVVNIRDITWRKQAEDELARATARLQVLAATDGLTGLANRRSFDETLQREWRRSRRMTSHLALLLIDVDWFKPYNDQYGHQKGDDALRALAACIARSLKRPGDFAARYGGEEFAVILPGNSDSGARQIAEAIAAGLTDLGIPNAGTPVGHLTLSIGVAAMVVGRDSETECLIAAADAALYAAKRAGRNRVMTQLPPIMALAAL